MKFIFGLIFLVGCSTFLKDRPNLGKSIFSYVDESGTYKFIRESKILDQKIITRNQLIDKSGSGQKLLEKSVLVSRKGSIKNKNGRLLTVRPEASEYVVWIEGKKYASKMRINPKNKSIELNLESPVPKWQGRSEIIFPKGKYFCFFSQLSECLYHNHLLKNSLEYDAVFDFFVVWDGYPFITELYTGVGSRLFVPATVKFDGEINGLFRYIVELEGQSILYQFSKSFELAKLAWISQGVTIVPLGEEIVDEEDL